MSGAPTSAQAASLRGWWPIILVFVAAPVVLLGASNVREALPAWAWAWGLTFALFGAMKWLTWRRTPAPQASAWLHLGYLFAWPGLDARRFFYSSAACDEPVDPRIGVVAFGKLFLGAALFWGAARMVPGDWPFVRAWLGLAGLAIGVLGGLFHLLSWLWRAGGVDVQPIMNRPLRSQSLAEFWGRRWNVAFHDFADRFVYRPLAARRKRAAAISSVFLFSGLVHEVVVSLPAGAGFGGPLAYFMLQLIGVGYEQASNLNQLHHTRGDRFIGRSYAAIFLLCPVGLLFHRPFVERVWLPFMAAVGAL